MDKGVGGQIMQTILLVEDNDNNANIIEDIFAFDDVPAKLHTVISGEDALRMAAEIQPALILMDLRLPGLDGLETTQLLKGNPLTKDIPVWAITAYSMKGDKERAQVAGCTKYFTKPINLKELIASLREFLQAGGEAMVAADASAEAS
jgi:CheY-like chemotaxis protein